MQSEREHQRLLHAVLFFADPLDTEIPIPSWAREELCDCDIAALHSLRCPGSPLFTEALYEMAEQPGYTDPLPPHDGDPWPEGWRIRYLCTGTRSGLGHHHQLGEINGPNHWCEGLRRFVEHGE